MQLFWLQGASIKDHDNNPPLSAFARRPDNYQDQLRRASF